MIVLSIIDCTPHLLKDQPENGLAIRPKHVAELQANII